MSFSISKVWQATTANVARNLSRYALPAAAFTFLPQLAAAFLAPAPETVQDFSRYDIALPLFIVSAIGLYGQIAILLLALNPERSDGNALRSTPALYLPALGIMVLTGAATFAGMLALVIPGLFLAARFAIALPAFVGAGGGVVENIGRSWDLTRGPQVWLPTMAALAILALFLLIGSSVGVMVGSLVDGEEPGLLTGLLTSGVAAVLAIYYSVFQAELFRSLSDR